MSCRAYPDLIENIVIHLLAEHARHIRISLTNGIYSSTTSTNSCHEDVGCSGLDDRHQTTYNVC